MMSIVAVMVSPGVTFTDEIAERYSPECSTNPRSSSTGPPDRTFAAPASLSHSIDSCSNRSPSVMPDAGRLMSSPMAPSSECAHRKTTAEANLGSAMPGIAMSSLPVRSVTGCTKPALSLDRPNVTAHRPGCKNRPVAHHARGRGGGVTKPRCCSTIAGI